MDLDRVYSIDSAREDGTLGRPIQKGGGTLQPLLEAKSDGEGMPLCNHVGYDRNLDDVNYFELMGLKLTQVQHTRAW